MAGAPIVYVEDDENDVLFLRNAFQKSGITNPLHVARDGEEALNYFKALDPTEHKPCLVLLDLKLPFVSGFDILEWLRAAEAFQKVPVCVLSSSDQPADLSRAKALGANDYYVKPTSPVKLRAVVEQIRERHLGVSGAALA